MEHVIAIAVFGLLCIVWAVIQQYSPRSCGSCRGCGHEEACAEAKGTIPSDDAAPRVETRPPPTVPVKTGLGECAKRRIKVGVALTLGLALGGWAAWEALGPDLPPQPVKQQRPLMGTLWTIEVLPTSSQTTAQVQAALNAGFDEVARIEAQMSEWRPGSPLSAVNDAAGLGPVPVPAELRALVQRGIEWGDKSEGAFDITWRGMGPVWRIYDEDFTVPSAQAVAEARQRVDYRKVQVDGDTVGLAQPGMAIGLGGIAKGYAVDRVAELLSREGLTSFSVAGAGDIRVVGGHHGRPWRIGVRDPRGGPEDLVAEVELTDGAVTTSGDYERFRLVDGVRYHHIIDPRTGYPAAGTRSVTIVSKRAETVDALATAAFVLGPERGLALVAATPDTEALIIDAGGRVHLSPGFGAVGHLLPTPAARQASR